MKVLAFVPQRLDSLVNEFAAKFPKLERPDIAIGRCKFYSMELVKFLRQRGVNAQLYHLQHIKSRASWPRAHPTWVNTTPKEWTHYIIRVGGTAIDITSRQVDSQNPHPNIYPFSEVKEHWHVVERDDFLNRVVREIENL